MILCSYQTIFASFLSLDHGIGYYHMNTREAIRVVLNRCDRKSKRAIGFLVFSSFFSVYAVIGTNVPFFLCVLVVYGILMKYNYDWFVENRQTKHAASRRLLAVGPASTSDISDVIEKGAYHLHDDKDNVTDEIPCAETLVDAAGCGMLPLYDLDE